MQTVPSDSGFKNHNTENYAGKRFSWKTQLIFTSVVCWWNTAVRMFLPNTFGHVVRNLCLPALAIAVVRLHTDSVFQRWQSTWCRRMPNAAPVCVAAVENPHTACLKVPGILRHTGQGIFLSNAAHLAAFWALQPNGFTCISKEAMFFSVQTQDWQNSN